MLIQVILWWEAAGCMDYIHTQHMYHIAKHSTIAGDVAQL